MRISDRSSDVCSSDLGWSVRQRNAVIQSLRLLQILRPTPTAKVRASDVVALRRYDGTITSTLDVLAEAGLLIEDVPTRVERYFNELGSATCRERVCQCV